MENIGFWYFQKKRSMGYTTTILALSCRCSQLVPSPNIFSQLCRDMILTFYWRGRRRVTIRTNSMYDMNHSSHVTKERIKLSRSLTLWTCLRWNLKGYHSFRSSMDIRYIYSNNWFLSSISEYVETVWDHSRTGRWLVWIKGNLVVSIRYTVKHKITYLSF